MGRLVAAILLVGAVAVGTTFAFVAVLPWLRWLIFALCLLAVFVAIGWLLSGAPQGIFCGKGKSWSLSITQALLWTVILLPAILTIWLERLGNTAAAGDITISNELVLLMGLPVAALTGAAAITAGKARNKGTPVNLDAKQLDYVRKHIDAFWSSYRTSETAAAYGVELDTRPPEELVKTLTSTAEHEPQSLGQLRAQLSSRLQPGEKKPRGIGPDIGGFLAYLESYLAQAHKGVLVVNLDRHEARPIDMLSGDEVDDADGTDFGKVQYFVISVLAMVAYIGLLLDYFGTEPLCAGAASCALPPAQGAILAILLTSTVGYLGLKGAPGTATR